MDGLSLNPIYYTSEHRAFADSVKRFVEKEISPYVNEWDEAGSFPRALYQKAANVGLMGLGYDAEHGGIPDADAFYVMLAAIEMAKAGSGGVHISLMIHSIGTPPIYHFARPEIRNDVMPQIIAGEKISALAITEPSGGSDVAAIKTKAVREGDHFILNGEKHYFSALDKISIFLDSKTRPKFVFYKENKQTNSFKVVNIPSSLAQDLINMFHVQVDFGGYNNVVRDIK